MPDAAPTPDPMAPILAELARSQREVARFVTEQRALMAEEEQRRARSIAAHEWVERRVTRPALVVQVVASTVAVVAMVGWLLKLTG